MNSKSLVLSAAIIGLLCIESTAYALRCGNTLISEGDSIAKVTQACDSGEVYTVNNKTADERTYHYSSGGMNYELEFIDGKLQSIDGSRF